MARSKEEERILNRVTVTLWMIIFLIIGVAYIIKDYVAGGLKGAIFGATSIVTQVYVTNPDYGSIVFLLAFIGKVLIIYIVYILIKLFSEGLFVRSLKEGKNMKDIKSLKDHYIICGAGRVGKNVADDLKGKPFVIVDKSPERVDMLKKKGILALEGDSLDDSVLKEAGIDKAKALISCLKNDGDNILQIIVAKKVNDKIKVLSRASNEKFVDNLKHTGADEIIIPEVIGGKKIAEKALNM
ncbi:MAG: potassium channel family protein [Nanobdellota archaeon]